MQFLNSPLRHQSVTLSSLSSSPVYVSVFGITHFMKLVVPLWCWLEFECVSCSQFSVLIMNIYPWRIIMLLNTAGWTCFKINHGSMFVHQMLFEKNFQQQNMWINRVFFIIVAKLGQIKISHSRVIELKGQGLWVSLSCIDAPCSSCRSLGRISDVV